MSLARFDGLVRLAGRLHIEQRLATEVREQSRLLHEALRTATQDVAGRQRALMEHVLSEMQEAMWQATEPERAEALGYAFGELVEVLLAIREGRLSGSAG